MIIRLILWFSLFILITGCETTSTYTDGHTAFEQKLTQIDLEMPIDDFLKVFPNAKLEQHKIDTYNDSNKSFERMDYSVSYNWDSSAYWFTFADGYLNSYSKSY